MASLSSRERVNALYSAREQMEREMAQISTRLTLPGSPGLKGSLVDKEGFPIAGVDLYSVRADRGRYAVLRNDHASITSELAIALADATKEAGAMAGVSGVTIKETSKDTSTSAPSTSTRTAAGNEAPGSGTPSTTDAFAVIDDLVEGSPAHAGGLLLGDQIVNFGDVEKNEQLGDTIPRVAAEAQAAASANVTKTVTVLRRGAVLELNVQPSAWPGGRGVLGCHMRPL